MKNQMSILVFLFSILLPLLTFAQWEMPYRSMQKNGFSVGYGTRQELRFGYERALYPRSSLNFALELGKKSLDPNLNTQNEQSVLSSFNREVRTEIIWFVLLPVSTTTSSAPLPAEHETVYREQYSRKGLSFFGEYKHFFASNLQRKVQNGFYLAPGLSVGTQHFVTYTFKEGKRNQVENLGSRTNWGGVPLLIGSTTTIRNELVKVVAYKEIQKDHKDKNFCRPHLGAGYQLPIGDSFSFDAGGRIFWVNKNYNPELDQKQQKAYTLRAVANCRMSFWL